MNSREVEASIIFAKMSKKKTPQILQELITLSKKPGFKKLIMKELENDKNHKTLRKCIDKCKKMLGGRLLLLSKLELEYLREKYNNNSELLRVDIKDLLDDLEEKTNNFVISINSKITELRKMAQKLKISDDMDTNPIFSLDIDAIIERARLRLKLEDLKASSTDLSARTEQIKEIENLLDLRGKPAKERSSSSLSGDIQKQFIKINNIASLLEVLLWSFLIPKRNEDNRKYTNSDYENFQKENIGIDRQFKLIIAILDKELRGLDSESSIDISSLKKEIYQLMQDGLNLYSNFDKLYFMERIRDTEFHTKQNDTKTQPQTQRKPQPLIISTQNSSTGSSTGSSKVNSMLRLFRSRRVAVHPEPFIYEDIDSAKT